MILKRSNFICTVARDLSIQIRLLLAWHGKSRIPVQEPIFVKSVESFEELFSDVLLFLSSSLANSVHGSGRVASEIDGQVGVEVESGNSVGEEVVPSGQDVFLDLLQETRIGQSFGKDESGAVDRPLHDFGRLRIKKVLLQHGQDDVRLLEQRKYSDDRCDIK